MSTTTYRVLIALFFIAHGLVHFSLTIVPEPAPGGQPTPFWPGWWRNAVDPLWLVSQMGVAPAAVHVLGWTL